MAGYPRPNFAERQEHPYHDWISGVPDGPGGGGARRGVVRKVAASADAASSLPIVQVLIPADFHGLSAITTHVLSYTWGDIHAGLDGIAIDLPALNVKPTHGDYVPKTNPVSVLAAWYAGVFGLFTFAFQMVIMLAAE